MSLWCHYADEKGRKCLKRLWPHERAGKTYKGETRPIVDRDENGRILKVRCTVHEGK